MIICRTISELRKELVKAGNKSIGFVPTMGALHMGHTALVDRCVKENDISVCSIFVNPTQFNNTEDLKKYPRSEKEDCLLLEKHRCDITFIPGVEEIYTDKRLLDINLGPLENVMEGKFRPGHFRGVVTVVDKLFRIVKPDNAYFGEKDFQQLAIIRFMVKTLRLPVKIIGCETVRENDGLAMSSRNIHLTPEERIAVPVIYKALIFVKKNFHENSSKELRQDAVKLIEATKILKVEYFEIASTETLQPAEIISNEIKYRACTAVITSKTRLIDNIELHAVSR